MFWCKIFQVRNEVVVAICDENLLDKVLNNNGNEVKISKHFYGENLIDEKKAVKTIKKATIGNIIGKNIVEVAKKNGFISQENIILIDGIPHAQFAKV
jgi:uncharacterized protein